MVTVHAISYPSMMRLLVSLGVAFVCAACSTDQFVAPDGAPANDASMDSTVGADGPTIDAINPMCTDGGSFCAQANGNLCDDFDTSAIDPTTWTTTKTAGAVVELTQSEAVTCPNSVHTSVTGLGGNARITTSKIPLSDNSTVTLDVDALLPTDTDTAVAFISLNVNGNAAQSVAIEHTQTQWQLGLHDTTSSQSAALTIVTGRWTHFTIKVVTQTDSAAGAGQYKFTVTLTYSTGAQVALGHDIGVPAGISSATLDLGISAVASTHSFDAYYDDALISN